MRLPRRIKVFNAFLVNTNHFFDKNDFFDVYIEIILTFSIYTYNIVIDYMELKMRRLYQNYIEKIIDDYNKMVFISGPRQVGKTTISKSILNDITNSSYLNWDYLEDRNIILGKYHELFVNTIATISDKKPRIVLDEIHKFHDWKNLVKGFYDKFGDKIEFIVTGSAKLNIYKKGGDSLMGRYINLTVHPLTVAEIIGNFKDIGKEFISTPKELNIDAYQALIEFSGFAECYLKSDKRFYNIWSKQRFEQLFREDVRNIEDINNLYSLELLATVLVEQVGELTSYTSLSKKVRVSDQTIRRWINLLEKHFYCYCLRPWSSNVVRSLIKEPKYYLWDWAQIRSEGARFENLIASHLFKAVDFWNESGMGSFGLHYIRDKQKREVDFLVVKNNKPWLLIECKLSDTNVSSNLKYFHETLKPEFSFQVVHNLSYKHTDCFSKPGLWTVPAITFLSQLV